MKLVLLTWICLLFTTACKVHTSTDDNTNEAENTPSEQELKFSKTTDIQNTITKYNHAGGDITTYFSYSPQENETIFLETTSLGTVSTCGKGRVYMYIQELDINNKVINSDDFILSQDYYIEKDGNYRIKVIISDQPACAAVVYNFTVRKVE